MELAQLSFGLAAFLFTTTSHVAQQLQAADSYSGSHALRSKQCETVPRDLWGLLNPKAVGSFLFRTSKISSHARQSQTFCHG